VCYEKNTAIKKVLFIYVFIVIVYIFYLLNVVTVAYDGGRCL